MKRFAVIISVVALALSCFGCSSNSQSSDNQSSSSDATVVVSEDILEISNPVPEPPIACTKKVEFQNISFMIPEEWESGIGVGDYMKVWSGEDIFGSMNIEASDLNANNTDEELLALPNSTREQQVANGFVLEEAFTVNRKGDLGYVIIPFAATQKDADGNEQNFWGYSFCGYDNELITANFSVTRNDKDVLATFRWILENIEVS